MKRAIAGLLACMGVWTHAEEFRIFTDTQGRAIEAKVVDFDDRKGQVKIERADGKRVWAPPEIFAQDDQAYIQEWIKANRILSKKNLRVSLDKERGERHGGRESLSEEEEVYFEVEFYNRTKEPIEGVRVEYKYFIEGHRGGHARTVNGSFVLNKLAPQGRRTIETKTTKLKTTYHIETEISSGYRTGRSSTSYYYVKDTEEDLDGFWVRIYGPEVNGISSYRDISYPSDLKDKRRWE